MATAELEGDATDDPLGVARMQMDLAKAQLGLGYAERAIDLFTKARATFTAHLGPDHPDTLRSMHWLASGYQDAGKVRPRRAALRGDAGPHEGEARPRPPRHPPDA